MSTPVTPADVAAAIEAERLVMRSPVGWAASLQDLFAAARAEGRAEGVKRIAKELLDIDLAEPIRRYRKHSTWLVGDERLLLEAADGIAGLIAELEKEPT